ncbi:hypothetical protein Pelo_10241 [Pelomyxa schiedti]|nr:hypothetical protein Pelo_10241 [Pelomyxa schiedti]
MSGATLRDLPRKGAMTMPYVPRQKLKEVPKYVCDHNTLPPENCRIPNDWRNSLIRTMESQQKLPIKRPPDEPPTTSSGTEPTEPSHPKRARKSS